MCSSFKGWPLGLLGLARKIEVIKKKKKIEKKEEKNNYHYHLIGGCYCFVKFLTILFLVNGGNFHMSLGFFSMPKCLLSKRCCPKVRQTFCSFRFYKPRD